MQIRQGVALASLMVATISSDFPPLAAEREFTTAFPQQALSWWQQAAVQSIEMPHYLLPLPRKKQPSCCLWGISIDSTATKSEATATTLPLDWRKHSGSGLYLQQQAAGMTDTPLASACRRSWRGVSSAHRLLPPTVRLPPLCCLSQGQKQGSCSGFSAAASGGQD